MLKFTFFKPKPAWGLTKNTFKMQPKSLELYMLKNLHVIAKLAKSSAMAGQDRSITESVVSGGFTKIHAYVNLRKALAPPISMANMSSEQCGKREPILRMWSKLQVWGNEWFCTFCDFLCVKDLWNTIFVCNLKLRCIIMWSDLWLRVV